MYILVGGLNHTTAPVEIREKTALSNAELDNAYAFFNRQENVKGTVILSTCNRVETYVMVKDAHAGAKTWRDFITRFSAIDNHELEPYIYLASCEDAVLHLFRVAAGLKSMIVGEAQILGQVKDAYNKSLEFKDNDGILHTLFQRAIHVGKRVRTETDIDRHPVSVGHAAVKLAAQVLGDLADKSVLVIGAGEMSEIALRSLMVQGVKTVVVSNRSYDRAEHMAAEYGGKAIRFDELPGELLKTDMVISCTAANHPIISRDNYGGVLQQRQGNDILLIDIAVPRDIDPDGLTDIPGVHLYDIDDLQQVVDAYQAEMQEAVDQANQIVDEEFREFCDWMTSLSVVPVVTALRKKADSIKQTELTRALNRLGNATAQEKKVIGSMANAIINQLLHFPIVNLKEIAGTTQGHMCAESLKHLFELEVEYEDYVEDGPLAAGNQGK